MSAVRADGVYDRCAGAFQQGHVEQLRKTLLAEQRHTGSSAHGGAYDSEWADGWVAAVR